MKSIRRRFLALAPVVALAGCGAPGDIHKINHVVVIYLENHSFDNLYGEFDGTENLSKATAAQWTQVGADGATLATLPQPMNSNLKPIAADTRFPADLPNKFFNIDQYVPSDQTTGDLVHRFYQEQLQIDGGKMDRFATVSDAKGLSLGYYHTAGLPLAAEAKKYTLCDHFHHAAFGGSFLNHIWLIAAQSISFPNAPASVVAQVDANGNMVKDGAVTPDGFVVNTSFSVNSPIPMSYDPAKLVPNQSLPTIGDRLSAAGKSWAWYSGGWDDAIAGKPDPKFQYHHQPFIYFANYGDGTQGRADHLKDEKQFLAAAADGSLPAVSFVKPVGAENEHPGYASVATGEQHAVDLVNAIRNGPNWKDTAIIITYDENGGYWDHVAPPTVDRWGPGSRVPTLVISPYARKGYVDHTVYDTTSILAFIEKRWALTALTTRDAAVADLQNSFDFDQ